MAVHRHCVLRDHPIGTTLSVILSGKSRDPGGVMPRARMSSNEGGTVDQRGDRRGSAGGPLGMSRLGALLEIDLRSLALFRIGVAVTLLADLASRVRDLEALYGARGILRPELARSLWELRVTVSPFTWAAEWTPWLWTGVFVLAAAAICLALGLIPRSAAAVAWFCLPPFRIATLGSTCQAIVTCCSSSCGASCCPRGPVCPYGPPRSA